MGDGGLRDLLGAEHPFHGGHAQDMLHVLAAGDGGSHRAWHLSMWLLCFPGSRQALLQPSAHLSWQLLRGCCQAPEPMPWDPCTNVAQAL